MNFKSRQVRDGHHVLGRFIHINIERHSFEAVLEVSRDDGKNWERVKRDPRQDATNSMPQSTVA